MPEPIVTKQCNKCNTIKSLFEFHKQAGCKDGHLNYCKVCRNKQKGDYKKTDTGKRANIRYKQTPKGKACAIRAVNRYRKQNPINGKAGNAVNNAIADGRIKRPDVFNCSCGEQAHQYHHPSYAKEHWLDVIPVCISCHTNIHHL